MEDNGSERFAQRKQRINDLRRRHTRDYYRDLSEAKATGKKVAWSRAGLAPALLDALGLAVCSPENYAALCAAKQAAGRFCAAAEAQGISADVCSYGRCIMGMMWEGEGPYGPLPQPDIVIMDSTVCDAYAKMWEMPALHYGVPSVRLDGGYFLNGQVSPRDVAYRVSELHRLVAFCEEQLGTKLDIDRFRENTRREAEVRALFDEIQTLRKQIPCPRSTRELASDVFYLATLPHTEEAVECIELVAEDCRDRVRNRVGAVANERFRLYYDNIPVWFWLQLFDFLEQQGAVCVSDSYTSSHANGYYFAGYRLDPDRPFESLALRQMYGHSCFGVEPNLASAATLIQDWRCDGAVVFVNRSCKLLSAGRYDRAQMLGRTFGFPVLEFAGDMADPLSIDRESVLDRAKQFLEMLEERGKGNHAAH